MPEQQGPLSEQLQAIQEAARQRALAAEQPLAAGATPHQGEASSSQAQRAAAVPGFEEVLQALPSSSDGDADPYAAAEPAEPPEAESEQYHSPSTSRPASPGLAEEVQETMQRMEQLVASYDGLMARQRQRQQAMPTGVRPVSSAAAGGLPAGSSAVPSRSTPPIAVPAAAAAATRRGIRPPAAAAASAATHSYSHSSRSWQQQGGSPSCPLGICWA